MRAIASLVFQVIALQLTRCRGGGPSTFGYDASSACGKPYSRAGRAHRDNLPCDFRRQNWCTVAGSSYPWHAVRRFVQENQGLMRRMYGDESYIDVLRAEFDKNDIELRYDDYHYHRSTNDFRHFRYDEDYELLDGEVRGFTSRSFHDAVAKRSNKFAKLSEYTRARLQATTSAPAATLDARLSSSTVTASTADVEATSNPPNLTTVLGDSADDRGLDATSNIATVAEIVKEQNFSINEIPGQNERMDEGVEKPLQLVGFLADTTEVEEDTTLQATDPTTNLPIESPTVHQDDALVAATKSTIRDTVATHEQQHFRPRPEYRPSVSSESVVTTAGTAGQLYQDVAAKEHQQEQPVLKLRGVNACPVKEEVVAPFWANNTRGEVLALLNLYPFEQYVHWEKCTHENKQMYCRDGCRCEQQYRLHRLLAYDPNNECRGIFSDWFKFPSCCVCRCYDLPLEFRVTSRSPRTQKRRIKVQPPRDRYA